MSETDNDLARQALGSARRIVVKVGSRVLVDERGRPSCARLGALVDQLSTLRESGRELVLVSSGAIAAGLELLGRRERPRSLPDLQMAAAVGQSRLMSIYAELFAVRGGHIGQVLLTHGDLEHRLRHLNARNTMMRLLREGILPIVNENDVIAVDEIKFGDNDHLASLVSMLVDAELLVLLTGVDGLLDGDRRRVRMLEAVTEEALALTWGKGSALSTGGMASKLEAARAAVSVGIPTLIADGRDPRVLERALRGDDVGTLIGAPRRGALALGSKKRWIAYFHRPEGSLNIDAGAERAVVERGKSLLPIGVCGVEGVFSMGAVVTIKGPSGRVLARGLVDYSSENIERIQGCRSGDIEAILGVRDYDAVVHRDNMALVRAGE